METNITEKLETLYGLECDEKLEVSDAQANKPEVTHKEEAIVTGNDIEEGSLENDRTKVDHSVYTGDKTVEQSLPVRSLTEPAPTLSGEDERSNIILEEVHDGHEIPVPGSEDVNNEQIFEANATFFTPKPIEKETTKKYQDSEKETKIPREEDGNLEVMKEGQVKELSPESIGKGPIQDFKEDEKEAYKDEILEKSQPARTGESIAHETNHDESPEEILRVSLEKQEEGLQGEVEHLVSIEASAENGDKGTSSVKVTEDNNDNNNIGLAEATGNSAKVTPQGEEDSEERLQIDETASIVVESPENIIIASSVKQKEDLQEEGEKLDSTEASIKNNDEETFSIKMAEDNDENNKPAETTETSVKVTPKGEEDSEHALQHDEPRETKLEFESPGEVLDTSLVGESTNLALAETSQEKREEGISSVKVVVDNNRQAETTENSAKATPEGEEDSDQMLQKDEPGEGITCETNNGAEIPENIPDPTLVTQEEGLQGESENLAPTEAAIEKRDEDTSYIKVTEDNDDNEQVEGTENSEKVTPKGGEDSEKILQIDEPGQSIVGMGNHNVDSPEGEEDSEHALQHDEPRETNHEFKSPGEVLDTSVVRKGLQEESTNLAPAETSQEKRDEGTSSAKIVVDNDKLVETTENSAKATPEGEEDSDQILQKDEPAEGITHETNNGAEIPENISDPTLMKQEEGLIGESKNLAPRTKAAIEKREEESYIKVTEDNENNEQAEVTENSEKVTPEGGEDSEKILQIDEPGQSIVGTENRNVESPEGEEDSEQALQHDEPQETNHEFKSPGEILDTSLVNPRKGLQGESTNLAQVETSQEKRDEAITSVKVAVDNDDNDKLAEATENRSKATPEAEVNSEIFLQKYEPGEGITHETDNGAEIPETISDPPLVKQEEGLQGEFENQAPTEAAIEKRDEDTSYINVVEDDDDNGQAEATENSEKVTPEGGEDSEKILQIDEPGQNIVGMENQNVASPENNLDTLFVKQEEVLQGGYNSAPTKTSIENSDEDTYFVEVAENSDENNRLAETMEDSVKVTPKGEENSEHVLQKDDPQERYHNVESPDNIFDNSLLNLEEDLHVDGEDLAPTEASIENKDEDSSLVKVAEHKDGNNRQDEARINNANGAPKGEEDSEHVLQKDAVDKSIACETDHEVEKHEKALNTPQAKQEECLQGQDENMIPTEASIEKRDGEMSSMKIAEGNNGINRVAEAEGNSVKETAKGEEELEPVFQRDANEKLEQVLDVTPEEMEAESSGENMKKTTCMKEEGIIQNLEEASETEKREETETIDDKKEKEAAREKERNPESVEQKNIVQIEGETERKMEMEPKLEAEDHIRESQKAKDTITAVSTTEKVHDGVEKVNGSENIREHEIDGGSDVKEIHTVSTRDEIAEKEKDSGPASTEYLKTIDSEEHTEATNTKIEEDPTGETETPVTKAPEEEKIPDKSGLEPADVHKGVEDVDESESTREQAIEGESNLKEIHTVLAKDEILEKEKDYCLESTECLKASYSKEQTETVNTNIEDPTGETKVLITEAPKEVKIPNEDGLEPVEEHEGVEKVSESENIIEQAEDRNSNLKETHAIFARDEILEEVKDCGPDSIEYVKTTDSKEQIETVNTDIEKDPIWESEAPVTKAPEEEKIQDEGILKPTDEHEGFDKTDERENIREEATDGDTGLKEIHTVSAGQEIVENSEDSGPKSIEYLKATDSKEQTKTVNMNIEKVTTGEIEVLVTRTPEEDSLKPVAVHEEVEKVNESKNIIEQAIDGESSLEEIHTRSVGDEILEKMNNSGPESSEYLKATDSKEHIGTANTNIEEYQTGEIEVPFTKAPEDEETRDEGTLKQADVHEGVEKVYESDNIIQQATDGESDMKEIHTISIEDEKLENVKDSSPESIEYFKEIDSKEHIETENKSIKEDLTGETEVPVTKAPKEETLLDEGSPKPVEVHEGVEKATESENIIEQPVDGVSNLKEIHTTSIGDEILEKVKDSSSESIEYLKEIDSKEHIETKNKSIKEDSTGETEVPATKAPKEETLLDEGSLKPVEVHEGVEKATESENIIEQPVDGVSNLKEIHTSSIGDGILEKVNNTGPESIEYLKETDSKEQIGTTNTNIEEYPTGETEAPFTKAPEEEDMKDEGTLKPADVREGVEKVDESDNIRQATDGESNIKKIHTISIGDEKLENVKDSGSESIEYFKEIDSKEHIETENKSIKEDPTRETEVPVTKAPKEETLLDEGSLTPLEVHEGVEKATESENIIEQPVDGVSNLKEIHTSIGDEMLEKVNNSGPESTEYLKATDSKEQIGTVNTNIEEYPTGETESPFTKAPEEEEMKDERTLKPADVRERVDKVDESDNIRQATDGESDMKKIHTISIGDEKLGNVKDSGSESIEYFKEIDSKEHIETENKGIKEDPTRETEVPVTKAPKEETLLDEGSLKPIEVHEGVQKATESENIIEQPVDGVNNSGPESTEYLKATDSKEQIGTANTNIEEYPTGETEAPFTKALEEEEMKDEGTLKPADVREGVEKVDKSDNIGQAEKLDNIKDSGSKSIEYFKEIDSKEHIETKNKGIKEDPTGETEVSLTKAPKEETLLDEGSLKPVEVHEGVQKATESENIIEQPIDGVSNLKEIHTSIGDEMLEKVNNSGPKSTEYLKATDSKEQIGIANTNIEEYPTGETEAPFTKALEEEEMKDEGTLKPADVHEGVEKVDESDNIGQATDGESDMKKIHTISIGDEKLDNIKDSGSKSIEYFKEIDSKEHIETENIGIKEDPTRETEVPVTNATKEENIPDEGSLKLIEVHEGVEKATESENIIEQPVDGVSNLKEIHTISIGDEILENVNDSGLESIEYLKETDSKEQMETLNTDIEKVSLEETEAPVIKAPEEQKIQDEGSLMTADVHEGVEQVAESEGSLKPVEVHEGVQKATESENIIEPVDGVSNLKEIHTFIGDEMLEKVNNSGPESTEYLKATDSKEQIRTSNTNIEEYPTRETEAPFTKAPEEEEMKDEGTLKPVNVRGGVQKVDESDNIRQATDGESDIKIHTISIGDEKLENLKDSSSKSIEYFKEIDSKEHIETENKGIKEDPTRETEVPVTNATKEENIPDEGSLKLIEVHEGVEKATESENIKEQPVDGVSNLKEIHTISIGDEILENVNDSGLESIEYLKETDSKEQMETLNTDIEKVSLEETEAPVIKAPEEQKIQDEGSLMTADVHEGVEQVAESENIIQQNKDGEKNMEEIHTGSTRDEIFENVKESGPKSTECLKETNSKEQTKAVNMDIGEDTTGEAEGLVNIAEVHEEVEKVSECKNTIEQVKNGESSLKEIRTRSTGDEIPEKMNDSGPDSTEYPNATGSKEQIITVNKNIEDPTGETEALVTKAPEEEEMQDEGILKPADVHEGFEKVDESVCIRQQAIEGESDLLKIHTISTGDKILENVKGSGSESSEYIKATDSMEHTETKNMDIKEDPTWEAEVPFIKEPKEENIPDEGSLNPTEAHEEVKKVHESENNIEQPVDGVSDLKEIYTKKSIGDEILEKVKKFGPESIEYLKETDSKEHIETLNTNFEKDSSSEPESFVTKVPAEEKIQDEGSLNTANMHEGVEQVDESENIIQQNPDGEHYSQEIHTGSTEDEILKNVENSGPKSTDIKEDTREIEASLTKEPKEEKIQDEGSLNPTDGHGGVEKVDRSENIREYAIAGESNLKEIHTTFVGDEILVKVKDSDLKSTEYHRATDSKEQIETVNTDIEEDPIQEMEAPITKAPEEEKIQDEDSFKPANVHEGVEKANGSENIEEQAIDGESNLKEIYTISVGDGITEKDKDFGPESINYLKETKSGGKIATIKTNIEEDPIGETEAIVTKAQEEEKIQDEGSLKAVDGHEGVEKADRSANNREQVIDGESNFKEIHKVSLGDDTLNKVKYCSPESTVYLKATDSEEHIETVNTTIKEDPIEETEVPATRALEEEEEEKIQDEGRVKPTNVSMTVAEDEEEKIKEDIKVEVDNFPENADNAIVIPAEPSLGEAQMDDKRVMDTSSDESFKTINAEPCPHAEEVGNLIPEKTSFSLVSQLPNMKHDNIETETVTPEKSDADEETKTVSDAVFQSKYHGVEETNETGQSLRVENFDADRTEEGIKEASGSVLEPKSLGTEAVIIDEITADQNLTAGKLEEQLQTPSSESLSWEQEHGPTTIVKETEAIKAKEGEILDNKNISDSSATKATEETCLQKEEQPETLSSTFLSTEQEHRTTTTFKKTEEENIKEVEMLDEKGINNFSAIKAAEEACLEQEEPKEFAVSKLGLLDGASKLETADKEECEKIKELTSPIEDASNLSFETSEKALETILDVHSREALINSEEGIQDKGIMKPEGVSITVAKDSFEYIKEEIKVDDICDKTENATAEVVTAEPSSVEAQLNDKSTEDTISDDRVETSIRESNPPAEEVASMKLEKTSSNLPSQLLNVATKNEEKESETLENPDANEAEETETASNAVFESKYEGIKETGETGESLKVEKLDAADIEEMKETSEIPSKSKALSLVEVSEDEVIADHCVSEVQSHEVLTKSENINEKHLQTAIPDLNTEESESQCKKTVEANKILKNKVFIEEGTEEQEFTKDAKSVTLGEETIIESHQGYESRSEEYPAEETNRTYEATTDAHQHEALRLSEIIDEGNVSEDIAKTIQVEDRTVENENAAESYLDKIQGKTVKEAAMKLDLENQSGDTNFTKAITEVMTLEEKEAGIEILQKEGTLGIAEVKEITQNIQQLETTSYAASETKIPGEECPSENTETIITTAHEDVQPVLQHPLDKALEKVEQKDTRPGKSTEADAEVREVECEGEKRIGDLGEILTEKSTSEDSAKISLSNLMHRSKKENLQVTKDLTKEREQVPSKEEMQNQEAETTVDETKTDEEEGDEHKRTDPGYDAPVMVEAAKDIDVKVVHKKHNILSGVGSKVKHSLSKVKKAITGKSSHPKTTSPK
ncbi:hypothetical protein ACB098_01G263700 [Castanea mollissima]